MVLHLRVPSSTILAATSSLEVKISALSKEGSVTFVCYKVTGRACTTRDPSNEESTVLEVLSP